MGKKKRKQPQLVPKGPPPLPKPKLKVPFLCPDCGAPMVLRRGPWNLFWGCSAFGRTPCLCTQAADSLGYPVGKPSTTASKSARKDRAEEKRKATVVPLSDERMREIGRGQHPPKTTKATEKVQLSPEQQKARTDGKAPWEE